jgi:hypothetical protein
MPPSYQRLSKKKWDSTLVLTSTRIWDSCLKDPFYGLNNIDEYFSYNDKILEGIEYVSLIQKCMLS